MVVVWDASLSVGHEEIDRDHQHFIKMINSLHAAVDRKAGDTIIGEVLAQLCDYAGYHFSREEYVMKATRYPEFDKHAQQHTQIIEKISILVYEYEMGRNTVTSATLDLLGQWFCNHVRGADQRLADHLRRQPFPAARLSDGGVVPHA